MLKRNLIAGNLKCLRAALRRSMLRVLHIDFTDSVHAETERLLRGGCRRPNDGGGDGASNGSKAVALVAMVVGVIGQGDFELSFVSHGAR